MGAFFSNENYFSARPGTTSSKFGVFSPLKKLG